MGIKLNSGYMFWVPGPLPGMNEIIAACKSGRGKFNGYSWLKNQLTKLVADMCIGSCPVFENVSIKFIWVEKHKRRDPDNIASAKKFILDGMVRAGMIHSDGWKHVFGWTDQFQVNKKDPGVFVEVRECTTDPGTEFEEK